MKKPLKLRFFTQFDNGKRPTLAYLAACAKLPLDQTDERLSLKAQKFLTLVVQQDRLVQHDGNSGPVTIGEVIKLKHQRGMEPFLLATFCGPHLIRELQQKLFAPYAGLWVLYES